VGRFVFERIDRVYVWENMKGGADVWQCDADLPRGFRFGEINMNCEGWNGPNDIFVMHGA
jgi:hypothetical protein